MLKTNKSAELRQICNAVFVCALTVWGGAPASAPLRIAVFNLKWLTASADENKMDPWNDEDALEKHRRDLERVLATVRADVVCVLESTSRAALEKLTAEPGLRPLGYRVYHVESMDNFTGQDMAFLARVPLDSVAGGEIHDFPSKYNDQLTKRAVIFLTVGRLKLGLLGLHLVAHPDDRYRNRKREAQAKSAARMIRNEIVARGYTPIILGDLNDFDPDVRGASGDYPRSRVLRILKDFDGKHPGDEMFNAAGKIQPESDRYSTYWDFNKNGKWDKGEPVSLLDHILLARSLSARLLKTVILHEPPDGSASDHWPVVVELE